MDWGNWAQKPPESSLDLLVKFKSKIKNRNNRQLSFLQFVQWTEDFVQAHVHLELPQLIVQSGLKGAEMVYIMHMCLQHFQGDEFVEVESILTDFNPSMEETYHLRTSFKSNKSIFHKLKLVETTNDESFMSMPCLRLTEKVTNTFTKIQTKEQNFTSELLTAVLPENIELQPLFYEDDVHQKIQRLSNLFTADQFNRFTTTMKTKGMKAGITVIFHGAPGTGKTETVYQLAKQTNKAILMADVSTLRSKWVGDSEKNIRQLFTDYKNACKSYEQIPILLFNEADAILGKRTEVKDRGDQMSNSVQNILLEELEKFEGIFIATTNLEKNLDQAFERRILYKIKYEKPSTTTTFHILQSKFPEIDTSILKNISTNNTLTGGQIENIRKKLFVDTLLQPDLPIDAGYFDQLVKQELYHLTTDDNRNPIGFNR
jgi:SpoVK/Ycf46/Vps4 family AAA+-type ATPase